MAEELMSKPYFTEAIRFSYVKARHQELSNQICLLSLMKDNEDNVCDHYQPKIDSHICTAEPSNKLRYIAINEKPLITFPHIEKAQ